MGVRLKMKYTLVILGVLAVHLLTAEARPSRRQRMNGMEYLHKYGYLPHSKTGPAHIRKAVMMAQKFMGIPMTGQLDTKTMDMMNQPRCGVKDMDMKDSDFEDGDSIPERLTAVEYNLGPSKWDKKDLTYRFENYSPQLEKRVVRQAVVDAFAMWSEVTELNFFEASAGEDADIFIEFTRWYHGDGYPFDEFGGVLAHAFYPGGGIGGDVHFDEAEPWTDDTYKGINLFTVAVHEIGHALGLGHSPAEMDSIMYPSYKGYDPDLQLAYDDIIAIQTLYGSRYNPRPTEAPTKTTTTTEEPEEPKEPDEPEEPVDPKKAPNPCHVSMDSAAHITMNDMAAGTLFFFHGKWFWRRNYDNMIEVSTIHTKWPGLPSHVDHIDAVYQRPEDDKIIIFSGERYWIFDGRSRERGFPKHGRGLTDFGLPASLDRIDAAFVWGRNSKTYLVSGDRFWGLGDDGMVEDHYPRDMSLWDGAPAPPDAAFQLWDGRTYFFKDQDTYVFNDDRMTVFLTNRGDLGSYWLWCNRL